MKHSKTKARSNNKYSNERNYFQIYFDREKWRT